MLIVTAGTAEYRPYIERQSQFCAAHGYGHLVYDLGGLGMGTPYDVDPQDLAPTVGGGLPMARFKPRMLKESMRRQRSNEWVLWIDGDCVPIRELSIPDAASFAVTLRPEAELGASGIVATDWLNSGVVFARNNLVGSFMVDQWQLQCINYGDQEALNYVVGRGWGKAEWESARGSIHNGVGILSCPEWNCWQFPPPEGVRILHYKRGLRGMVGLR